MPHIAALNQSDDDEVVQLSMQKINMMSALQFRRKLNKAGKKAISLEKRKKVWDVWHSHAYQSTITPHPAKTSS